MDASHTTAQFDTPGLTTGSGHDASEPRIPRRDQRKELTFVVLAAVLLVAFAALENLTWPHGNIHLHTLMETAATLLALIVAAVALVRYYAKRHYTILLLGVGFLGTGLLDGYHGLVTSEPVLPYFPSDNYSLAPWSWNASRIFFAALMFLSWLAQRREQKLGEAGQLGEVAIYAVTGLLTLATFMFFAFVPLGDAYFPDLLFGRPEEFIAAVFFALALYGHLSDQGWRENSLQFWIVLSLIVGLICQLFYMPRSFALFDGMFDAAHLLKIVSYLLVFVGLLAEISSTWRREQAFAAELEARVHERTASLEKANDLLEESNIELQQFAYIASHDLQSPLRAVAGFAQFLQKDYQGKLSDEADGYINRIVQGCKRMQQLINDLLSFSRVQSRSRPFERVDLNGVIEDAIGMLQSSLKDSGGTVTFDDLPVIRGDRSQLSQLLQNLIGNGLKYAGDSPPQVHAWAEPGNGEWTICIRDNGIGIDHRHHRKIFEIFRRLHTDDEYPGTGIGLAVCRRIVTRHGGRIWVESAEGSGSTFHFTIPVATES